MRDSDYHVPIPTEVVKKLHLKAGEKLDLKVDNKGLTLDKQSDQLANEWDTSIWWIVIPALLGGIAFWFYFQWNKFGMVPLSGRKSIASGTIILGVFFGFFLFTIFLVRSRKNDWNTLYRNIYWRNFPTIVISFTAILLVALIGIFWILGTCFAGTEFEPVTASIIVAVFEAIVNYVMIKLAVSLTPTVLVDILNLIIIIGILISMATNSHKHWWRHNLSYLGGDRAIDSWQFNLTVIVTALLLLAMIDYLFVSLRAVQKPNIHTTTLRVLLSLLAISVGCVGIFHNNRDVPWMHFVHTQFGWSLVIIMILLIGGIKWLWPGVSKNFVMISYLVGLILIISSVLFWFTNFLALTAFELISFASAFAWIMMLFQYILDFINKGSTQFVVTLKD